MNSLLNVGIALLAILAAVLLNQNAEGTSWTDNHDTLIGFPDCLVASRPDICVMPVNNSIHINNAKACDFVNNGLLEYCNEALVNATMECRAAVYSHHCSDLCASCHNDTSLRPCQASCQLVSDWCPQHVLERCVVLCANDTAADCKPLIPVNMVRIAEIFAGPGMNVLSESNWNWLFLK